LAHSITTINKATDTFDTWVDKTNEMANVFSQEALTANTNANGAYVTGNSFMFGIFGSNTIAVHTGLRGGNVQTSAVLTIVSNVLCNATSITVGNSTVNAVTNAYAFIASNNLLVATLSYTGLAVGANVIANLSGFIVGNSIGSTIQSNIAFYAGNSVTNSTQNSVGFYIGTSVVNSSVLAAGANVYANVTHLFLGNATVNVVTNSSAILLGGNVLANQTSLSIGNSTVNIVSNSSTVILGGNVLANQTHFFVGNTTVNVSINSSAVSIGGQGLVSNATKASVAWENTLIGSRARVNFIAGNNVYLNVTDDGSGSQVNVQVNAVATSGAAIIGGTNSAVCFNDNMNFGGDASKFSFDKVNSILTVSNTTVSNVVQLSHSIIMTGNTSAFVTSSGPDTIEALNKTAYRTAEFLYYIKNDSANQYQIGKLLVLNDGTNGILEEFGVNYNNNQLGTFGATSNATHILVQFTPDSALSYTTKITKTAIPV